MIKKITDGMYEITSKGNTYQVDVDNNTCTCKGWFYGKKIKDGKKWCKHLEMVERLEKDEQEK